MIGKSCYCVPLTRCAFFDRLTAAREPVYDSDILASLVGLRPSRINHHLAETNGFFFFFAIFVWKTFPRHQSRDHCNVLIYFFDIFFSCLVMHSQSDNSFETSKNVVFLITKSIFFSIHKHRSQNGFVFFLKTNIINLFIIILLLLFFVC